MILQNLQKKKLSHAPDWLPNNTHMVTIMGSNAYGCAETDSDLDMYGFCIPPREILCPWMSGKVYGFDDMHDFQQWQEHHIKDESALSGKGREYDFQIFNITKYFRLLMDNNPNIIDSIFTPINCVVHISELGNMVRNNRKLFLHKGAYHKFRGYAYSQQAKMASKNPDLGSKRQELREKFGYDIKFGYHVVRLALECEQILSTQDLNLQRDNEVLKSIRRGEWTEEKIRLFFAEKEKYLEGLYETSSLPYGPDVDKIRVLLVSCLEHHYGNIENMYKEVGKEARILQEIKTLVGQIT